MAALPINITCEKFSGEPGDDPIEWVKKFNRLKIAYNWTDDDNDHSEAWKMAVVHLDGEAAQWAYDNQATYTRWSAGNQNLQLSHALVAKYNTPERSQRLQREFYSVIQKPGEDVDEYTQRFRKISRRIGNDITEIGKAGTYTRGLLPAIQNYAILGDQDTLDKAIESAKRAEMSVLGSYRQMLPKPETAIDALNRTFQNVIEEKKNEDMNILKKQLEKMIYLLRNELKKNRGYNKTRNVECFYCKNEGHYARRCPERELPNQSENNIPHRNEDEDTNEDHKNVKCFQCEEFGHYAYNCPTGKQRENHEEKMLDD
jgi:Retrotransposon gag protein/Zinc knuckle